MKKLHNSPLFLLGVFTGLFLLWSCYRFFFKFPEWIDEIVWKPVLLLFPILFILHKSKQNVSKTLGLRFHNWIQHSFLGVACGCLFSCEAVLTKFMKYHALSINPLRYSVYTFLFPLMVTFVTAGIEEVVFRGYFLSRFIQVTKNTVLSNGIASCMFVCIHLPLYLFVYHYPLSMLLISLVLLFILGVINGLLFIKTKSLVSPVFSHAIWNIANIFFQ